MKWNIFKKEEKRNGEINYVSQYSDALNFTNLVNKYSALNISSVYRATEIISDAIAVLPIVVKMQDKTHKSEINHSLNVVFKNELGGLTKYNFMKLLIQSVILKGNGFAYIERNEDGSVKALRFLQSSDVIINYDKIKNTLTYSIPIISKRRIEPINIIHLRKNTYDGVNGISVISYGVRSIANANNTENSANSFFTKGCNLAGVLTVQGQLNEQQRKDIRSSWNNAYSDGGNGLAILQGNMQYQPIQLNASDSQLIESRVFNVTDIARFFGISPVLLGDLTHSSYSTIEATQNQFLLHTLMPYIEMVEEEFTNKLLKPSEYNFSIDLDEKALMKTDKTQQASYYATMLDKGILCVNEVRKELGYSEIEGGDRHIIPYTKIQDNTINNKQNQ